MNRKPNILAVFLVLAWVGAAFGGIAIPGYDALTFAAGAAAQDVNFHNPSENACLFRLTLALADGTTLWRSGLLKPGEAVRRITLERDLDGGTYAAVLRYECFSLEGQSPLNGANIVLTLTVRRGTQQEE